MMHITRVTVRLPGLLVVSCLAALGSGLAHLLSRAGIAASPLVVALVLGLVLAWPLPARETFAPGLAFACRPLLRLAIVLLGLRMGFDEAASLGTGGLAAIATIVTASMAMTYAVSRRLGLSSDLAWLLASGHAICGAAAVAAADSVLKTRPQDAALALALVTLMGTVVMLVCPLLGRFLDLEPASYGFWVGGSVHEVAQAVAAGYALGEESGEAASLVKMVRVSFLLPLGLLLCVVGAARTVDRGTSRRILVPWFVVGFAVVALWNRTGTVPESVIQFLNGLCTVLMTMAMAALGLLTRWSGITATGVRPLVAAGAATAWISVLGLVLAL